MAHTERVLPRNYQVELAQLSKHNNLVIALGTGAGKTYIAVLAARDRTQEVIGSLKDGAKRIVFLAPTRVLVHQQSSYMSHHTEYKVGRYTGDDNVDAWSENRWGNEFEENHVLVMTHQVFGDILSHKYFNMSQVSLLIIDECHSAVKDSPLMQILKFRDQAVARSAAPRILGLTASLINKETTLVKLRDEISELERNIGGKAITASDTEQVRRFATKAVIEQVFYSVSGNDDVAKKFETFIDSMIARFDNLPCAIRKAGANPKEVPNPVKDPKKLLKDCQTILSMIGVLGLHYHIQSSFFIVEKLRISAYTSDQIECLDMLVLIIVNLSDMCKQILEPLPAAQRIIRFTSPKVKRLFEILGRYKNVQPSGFRCLIFVEQKVVSKVLQLVLKEAISSNTNLQFANPLYIMGGDMSSKFMSKETEVDCLKQTKIMERFRSGSCNVLVSTSVLEEGIDVRECNLVIRFDLPKNYRGFVQSKGRARAEEAKYVLMIDVADDKFPKKLGLYSAIENILMTQYRPEMVDVEDTEDFIPGDDAEYAPFGIHGPRINSAQSVSNLHRYCDKLPSDRFTLLYPRFEFRSILDPDSFQMRYICTVTMPINAQIASRRPVQGDAKPSKVLARRSCALKMIKILHEAKELDDEHLLPVEMSRYLSAFDDKSDVTVELEEDRAETQKTSHVYPRKVPDELVPSVVPDVDVFLHVINTHVVEGDKSKPSYRLGLLVPSKLPNLCRFSIYGREGPVIVSIAEGVQLKIPPQQFQSIFLFHKLLCEDALHADVRPELRLDPFGAKEKTWIVPVEAGSLKVAFHVLNDCLNKKNFLSEQSRTVANNSRQKFVFNAEDYLDTVVTRWYENDQTGKYLYVKEVLRDERPSSQFHDVQARTFNDYYRQNYGVTVANQSQSLLLAEYAPSGLNFLRDRELNKQEKRQAKREVWLVPELCYRHPIRASIWKQAVYIPTIFRRLSGLLNAERLRKEICSASGLGLLNCPKWEDLSPANPAADQRPLENSFQNEETADSDPYDSDVSEPDLAKCHFPSRVLTGNLDQGKDATDILVDMDIEALGPVTKAFVNKYEALLDTVLTDQRLKNQNVSFTNQKSPPPLPDSFKLWKRHDPKGPSPGLILQALTTMKANDTIDLERLELVGDSFLKYCVSVHLFFKYPNTNEGRLTECRSARISNSFLSQIGKKLGIPGLIINSDLYIKNSSSQSANWVPPCFSSTDQKTSVIEIMNKRIADTMEALIGCYLVSMGEAGTKEFIRLLGLQVTPLALEDVLDRLKPPLNLDLDRSYISKRLNEELSVCSALIENKLGYKFKQKAYMLQALMHPSYQQNVITECYQRLEFLGDAVIDFLVTCYIFNHQRRFGPGELTDLRSALVNNTTFACIAVRNDFHKYLKRSSPALASSIERFVSAQERDGHRVNFYRFRINEEDTMEIDEIEVPKTLGDVIESLCGAVYLDSGLSLDAVWSVVYKLLHKEMDEFSKDIPISPIRELYERFPHKGKLKFGEPIKREDGRLVVEVTVQKDGREFSHRGCGQTRKLARLAAAKIAVRYDRERDENNDPRRNLF